MKERPILFSGAMVRAILDGRKTQTRRVVKLPHNNPLGEWEPTKFGGPQGGRTAAGDIVPEQGAIWHTRTGDCLTCPHGQPGDRLWVRETYAYVGPGSGSDLPSYVEERQKPENHKPANCWYRASGEENIIWTPSIHMPRWASRITLEVTGVRAERLQDISEADAIAEGIDKTAAGFWSTYCQSDVDGTYSPRLSYQCLWNSINAARGFGWDANPWVWIMEFRGAI
ncbi:hypothetical protein [Burkholderia thailandensis]|uniref:hypothetical protein n=1 Tax=Burkholderia thailandensis TaxID=57975 RepID=UPI00107E96AD|nr:hypothetical protein [Burkholderia thailandensis]TGB34866.1 hypothetical protein C6946_04595 [Burkholderia thailandensis]